MCIRDSIRIVRNVSLVDDYFEILLYYPSLRVRLHSSYLVREALPGYILHGTKGSFIKAKTDVQESMLQAGVLPDIEDWGVEPESEKGLLHTEKDGQVLKEYKPSLRGNYLEYFEGMYSAINKNEAPPVSAQDGLNVVYIIQKAFQSNHEKKVIKL